MLKAKVRSLLSSIILTFLLNGICAQNLIPNGSFEDTIHCPINGDFNALKNWFNPNTFTPNFLYRNCSGVPQGGWWYQEPNDGDGYILLALKETSSNLREYAGVRLEKTLIQNKYYQFTCYVSLLDSLNLCTSSFHVLLTQDSIFQNNSFHIAMQPSYKNKLMLYDKESWMKISFIYKSGGGGGKLYLSRKFLFGFTNNG